MTAPGYRERLSPSPGWWCAALAFGVLLGLVVLPIDAVAGAVVTVLGAVAAGCALWWSSPVVSVDGTELRAGRAHVPVDLLGAVEPLDAAQVRVALGPELDARAYVCLRTWARRAVRIELEDPQDPTPYWLVSTRHPERLATAVAAARGTDTAADRAAG